MNHITAYSWCSRSNFYHSKASRAEALYVRAQLQVIWLSVRVENTGWSSRGSVQSAIGQKVVSDACMQSGNMQSYRHALYAMHPVMMLSSDSFVFDSVTCMLSNINKARLLSPEQPYSSRVIPIRGISSSIKPYQSCIHACSVSPLQFLDRISHSLLFFFCIAWN